MYEERVDARTRERMVAAAALVMAGVMTVVSVMATQTHELDWSAPLGTTSWTWLPLWLVPLLELCLAVPCAVVAGGAGWRFALLGGLLMQVVGGLLVSIQVPMTAALVPISLGVALVLAATSGLLRSRGAPGWHWGLWTGAYLAGVVFGWDGVLLLDGGDWAAYVWLVRIRWDGWDVGVGLSAPSWRLCFLLLALLTLAVLSNARQLPRDAEGLQPRPNLLAVELAAVAASVWIVTMLAGLPIYLLLFGTKLQIVLLWLGCTGPLLPAGLASWRRGGLAARGRAAGIAVKTWSAKLTAACGGVALLVGLVNACLIAAVMLGGLDRLGATVAEQRWLVAVAPLAQLCVFAPGAALVAQVGRRSVLVGGLFAVLAGAVACAAVSTVAQLLAALVVVGIGAGVALAAESDAVAARGERGWRRWAAWFCWHLLGLVAGWVAGLLLAASAWPLAFAAVASVLLVAAFWSSDDDVARRPRPAWLAIAFWSVSSVALGLAIVGVPGPRWTAFAMWPAMAAYVVAVVYRAWRHRGGLLLAVLYALLDVALQNITSWGVLSTAISAVAGASDRALLGPLELVSIGWLTLLATRLAVVARENQAAAGVR